MRHNAVSRQSLTAHIIANSGNSKVKIDVTIQKDAQLDQAVLDNMTYIKNETLTEHLNLIDNIADGVEIVFDTIETKLAIKKH